MTDGASATVNREAFLARLAWPGFAADIPIHPVAFGEVDEVQPEGLNAATVGRLFTAGSDLPKAMCDAWGYP